VTPDQRVERQASRRFGIFTAQHALDAGMTRRMIRQRVATGRWIRIFTDVFRVAGAPESWHGRLAAAEEWVGPETIFSHLTAGALYGLDGVPKGIVELTAPTTKSDHRVTIHRRRGGPLRSRSVRGFRVTTVEQTLLDLCAVLPPVKCGRALDDALRRRLTTLPRLQEHLDCSKSKSGAPVLRRLLSFRDDRDSEVASRLETRLLRILKRISGHGFVPQLRVEAAGHIYFLDFGFPAEMVAVEGHSIRWHLGEDAFKSDVKRDRRLTLLGWRVLYFLWDEVWFEPERVEAEVRAALRSVRENDRGGHFTGQIF
jgi:very-short-patch-repair endonuclease